MVTRNKASRTLFAGLIVGLVSCQTQQVVYEPEAPAPSSAMDAYATMKAISDVGLDSAVRFRTKRDSGKVKTVSLQGDSVVATVPLSQALDADTLQIDYVSLGLKLATVQFTQTGTNPRLSYAKSVLNPANEAAKALLADYDSARKANPTAYSKQDSKTKILSDLQKLYATGLVAGKVAYKGYPGLAPAGLDTTGIRTLAVTIAVKSGQPLATLLVTWSLDLTPDAVRAVIGQLVAAGSLTPSDTAKFLPGPSLRVKDSVSVSPKQVVRGSTAVLSGSFAWSGSTLPTIGVSVTKGGAKANGVAVVLGSGSALAPTDTQIQLSNSYSLIVDAAADTGEYLLVVKASKEVSSQAKFTVVPAPSNPPRIALVAPAKDDDTIDFSQRTYHVAWTISGDFLANNVTLQGKAVAAVSGAWASDLAIDPTGKATAVQISVLDKDGTPATLAFHVTRRADLERPSITAQSGTVGRTVDNSVDQILVAWTVSDNDSVASVKIGDSLVPGANGIYSRTVKLPVGADTIRIVARDPRGNERTDSIVVVRDVANGAPSITGIGDLAVEPGTGRQSRSFQVSDDRTPAKGLTVTVKTDNAAILPLDSIAFGASLDLNRSIQYTPVAGAYGTVSVTLTAVDADQKSGSTTWRLTVNPPAAFSGLPAKAVVSDRDTSISFLLAPDTARPHAVSSSDPSLVPLADSQLVAKSGSWLLRLHPRLHGSGTSRLILSSLRGSVTTFDTLDVQVVPQNQAPSIDSIPDWSGLEGQAAAKIKIKVRDDLTAAANLAVIATSSDTNLVAVAVETGDSARWLSITPKAGTGSAQISVTATDAAGLKFVRTFKATLVHVNKPPQYTGISGPFTTRTYHDTFSVAVFTNGNAGESGAAFSAELQLQSWTDSAFASGLRIGTDGILRGRAPLDTARNVSFRFRLKDNGGTANGGTDTTAWSAWQTLVLVDTIQDVQGIAYKVQRMPDKKVWMRTNLKTTPSRLLDYQSAADFDRKKDTIRYGWAQAMNLPARCDTEYCASLVATPHQGMCPKGWHIPARSEWVSLFVASGISGTDSTVALRSADKSWYSYGRNSVGDIEYSYFPGKNSYRNFLVANAMNGGSGSGGSFVRFILPWSEKASTGAFYYSLEISGLALWDYQEMSGIESSVRCVEN